MMKRYLLFAGTFTVLLGPWGAGGALLCLLLFRYLPERSLFDIYRGRMFAQRNPFDNIIEQLEVVKTEEVRPMERTMDILSYREIMAGTDSKLKRDLISMISFLPTRENIALIKSALYDRDETIRVLASNALQKVNDDFFRRINDAEGEIARMLEEELGQPSLGQKYLELARMYDDHIFSGLADGMMLTFYRRNMMRYFRNAYGYSGGKKAFGLLYLRAALRHEYFPMAGWLIKHYEERHGADPDFLIWKAEYFYHMRDYRAAQTAVSRIPRGEIEKNAVLTKIYDWWTDEAS